LAALKRHEEALASYEAALALSPRHAGTLSNEPHALRSRPARRGARGYEQALAIEPRLVVALVQPRHPAARPRPSEGGAGELRAGARDRCQGSAAWNNRGVALHDLGLEAEALASYERALALWPASHDALFNRGNALLALRRPAEALGELCAASGAAAGPGRRPRQPRPCAVRSLPVRRGAGELRQALAIRPDHFEALNGRARVLVRLERHGEAGAVYERLCAIKPDAPNLAQRSRPLSRHGL